MRLARLALVRWASVMRLRKRARMMQPPRQMAVRLGNQVTDWPKSGSFSRQMGASDVVA